MDYYQILGIDRKASEPEIKLAYRKLAKLYHPDKNIGDLVAEEKFKQITEAYTVLSNASHKAIYEFSNESFNQPWVNSYTFDEKADKHSRHNAGAFNYNLGKKKNSINPNRTRWIAGISVVSIILFIAAIGYMLLSYSSKYYYSTGMEEYNNKQYAAALQNLEQSFSLFGVDNTAAYLLTGKILTTQYQDYSKALYYIDKGLAMANNNDLKAELYYLKGKCLKGQKKFRSAYTNYKLAAILNLNLDSLYHDLGELNCFVFKNYDDAIKYFNTLIMMNPSFTDGYIGRAFSYQKIGEHQKAVTDLKKFIQLDDQKGTAYYLKAISETALNHPTIACHDLQKAVKLGSEGALKLFNKTCN